MGLNKCLVLICGCLVVFVMVAYGAPTKLIMNGGESTVINGKNITFIGISPRDINFEVDGIRGGVELNTSRVINGVNMTPTGFSKLPLMVIVLFEVPFVCGDNSCSQYEDHTICCADCGCLASVNSCVNNKCVENVSSEEASYECSVNEDCDDGNVCTTDTCDSSAAPYTCLVKEIVACVAGDACCPQTCSTETDKDCAVIDTCETAGDCDDGNACTTDACTGSPKRCSHSREEGGCSLQGRCADPGTVSGGTFCAEATNQWESQRSDDVKCKEDFECISGSCKSGGCGGRSHGGYQIVLYIGIIAVIGAGIMHGIIAARRRNN